MFSLRKLLGVRRLLPTACSILWAASVSPAAIYNHVSHDFRAGHQRTIVTVYGPKDFEKADREECIRAWRQHCALKWVVPERMAS